jgi:molybdopterin converting factor small subunit
MLLKIPSYFQPFTDWKTEITVDGKTVGEVMADLFKQYPGLKPHFYTHWGILSANVLIYLNKDEIFTKDGMDTKVMHGDKITFVPTASGG